MDYVHRPAAESNKPKILSGPMIQSNNKVNFQGRGKVGSGGSADPLKFGAEVRNRICHSCRTGVINVQITWFKAVTSKDTIQSSPQNQTEKYITKRNGLETVSVYSLYANSVNILLLKNTNKKA